MDQIDRAVVDEAGGILDINWVSDRIALGGWLETEEKMRAVARLGITHIIDMAWEHDDTPEAAKHGIKVLLNTTDDDFQPKGTELLERGVEFALDALRQSGSKMLIHCVAGRHRGPMMTLAVFCALGWSMEEAMRHISERRQIVDWSPVYVESVKAFLQEYRRDQAEDTSSSSQSRLAA
jgi:protein-tyrosine phosphatase